MAERGHGPVDPAGAGVVGRPVPDAEYWLCHGRAGTCGPPTVAAVLTDILGVPLHSYAEVKVRALSLDLIGFDLHPGRVPGAAGAGPENGWTGLSADDVAMLCQSYGVEVEVGLAGVDALEGYLAAGEAVIVTLDTEALRDGFDGSLPGLGLDYVHALVLTGIDRQAGVAFLNSPAEPGGTGVVLPLAELAEAWAASGSAVLRAVPAPARPAPPAWAGRSAGELAARGAGGEGWSDPWADIGEEILVAGLGGGVAVAVGGRPVFWLPFSFAVTAARAVP